MSATADVAGKRAVAGIDELQRLLDGSHPPPPFATSTDIWPLAFDVGRAVFEGRPSQRFYNPMGLVHGGWIATLLDTAMGCAVHTALDAGQAFTTIEMKSVFVKPVSEASGPLRCEGVLLHAGKRVAHAEGKVYDANGLLVAYGSETCMIFSTRAESR